MISSQVSFRAIDGHSVYCSTKGALDQLARCLALELGPHKVNQERYIFQIIQLQEKVTFFIYSRFSACAINLILFARMLQNDRNLASYCCLPDLLAVGTGGVCLACLYTCPFFYSLCLAGNRMAYYQPKIIYLYIVHLDNVVIPSIFTTEVVNV